MQKIKIKEFIKNILNIDPLDLKEDSEINISDKNVKILSYDIPSKKDVYMKVNRIIRKKNAIKYIINTDKESIECSLDHKSYVCLNNDENKSLFLTTEEIILSMYNNDIYLKTLNGYNKITEIKETKKAIPIFDLEIENTHNFYTNEILSHNSFGNPVTVSGGKAVEFYAHVRIWITRSEINKETEQNTMKFNFVKNKLANPFKIGVVTYKWGGGFDDASAIRQIALDAGIVTLTGKTYVFPEIDAKIIGKTKAAEFLRDNPEYVETVIKPLVTKYLETTYEVVDIEEPIQE